MRGFSDFEEADMPKPESRAFTSEEEAARVAAIEESRRKLQALEADRPLWEKAAKERRAREEVEEAEASAKIEAKKRKEKEQTRQQAERLRREQEEAEAQIRREQEKKDAERARQAQERRARRARWTSGRWTTARAVERFKETSDYFDMTRFSEEHPLFIDDVPWPTLRHPDAFSLPEDVDWDSVEYFFDVLKTHMRTQEYIAFVEKSHRRFHPDRWRSRGLFRAVLDSEQRNYMEIGTCTLDTRICISADSFSIAATTVSQALTPIWQKVRSLKQA
jgi:flagellar biosynthesis GTPase FlhF